MTDNIEKALRDALAASAQVYRQRASSMDTRVGREGEDILSAGLTHGNGEASFIETWEERKARRAREAEATKAVEHPNPRHIPQNVTVPLISREEAITKGLTRYYTGEKCSHGHRAERIVSTRTCVLCHREHQLSNKVMRGREARRLAKAEGKTRYFSEQKCPRGHVSERLVSTGKCVQCHNEDVAKQRRRKAQRVIQ